MQAKLLLMSLEILVKGLLWNLIICTLLLTYSELNPGHIEISGKTTIEFSGAKMSRSFIMLYPKAFYEVQIQSHSYCSSETPMIHLCRKDQALYLVTQAYCNLNQLCHDQIESLPGRGRQTGRILDHGWARQGFRFWLRTDCPTEPHRGEQLKLAWYWLLLICGERSPE